MFLKLHPIIDEKYLMNKGLIEKDMLFDEKSGSISFFDNGIKAETTFKM